MSSNFSRIVFPNAASCKFLSALGTLVDSGSALGVVNAGTPMGVQPRRDTSADRAYKLPMTVRLG